MNQQVSPEMVDQFHEQGYLLIPELFDPEKVAEMRDEANRILELRINSAIANDECNIDLVEDSDGKLSVRMMRVIDSSHLFHRLATNEITDCLRPLMDDEPISLDSTSKLNPKEPLPTLSPDTEGIESEDRQTDFPVHTDSVFYEERGFPSDIITSAIFLDDVEENSGPIEVWPGTHTEEFDFEDSDIGGWEVHRDQIDYDAGEPVLGPAGSMVIFHSRLVHSSEPNRSGRPRRLMIYGHAPESNVEADIEDGSARPELELGGSYPDPIIRTRYENEYYRKKRRGEFSDIFTAPTF